MAIDFLIDGAKSFGQIASDSAKNIFNDVTKNNSLLNKNFLSQGMMFGEGISGLDFGQIETPEMKEYLKALAINRIKETGNLQGNQLGYSDYDYKAPWSRPDTLKTSTGFTSPNAAIQNTLGASGFRLPETGGKVSFDSSGTNYDFGKGLGGLFGGFNPFNIVNRGGLKDILLKDETGTYDKGPFKGQSALQNFTPNIEITPKDIQDIFSGGKMLHKGEGEPWKTGDSEASPEISSYNQEQAKRNDIYRMQQGQVPTSTPVGTSATALAQIQEQIKAAAEKELPPPRPTVTKKPPPPRPTPRKSVGMMSSGPKRRSSRGVRRKPTVSAGPPNRSRIGGRYGL
jgi:hypothetical protein